MDWKLITNVTLSQREVTKISINGVDVWVKEKRPKGWSVTTLAPQPIPTYSMFAASNKNYAVFATDPALVTSPFTEAYNKDLSRIAAPNMSIYAQEMATASTSAYALYSGGIYTRASESTIRYSDLVEAYSTILVKSIPTELSLRGYHHAGTSVGDRAYFGGGTDPDTDAPVDFVNSYNNVLTRVIAPSLTKARSGCLGLSTNTYAIFAGGWDRGSKTFDMDAYDADVTKTHATMSSSFGRLEGDLNNVAKLNSGAIIFEMLTSRTKIHVINDDLTSLTLAAQISEYRANSTAASIDGFALLAGPVGKSSGKTIITLNADYTLTYDVDLSRPRWRIAAATVNNYALFVGGVSTAPYEGQVEGIVDAVSFGG